jgi:hypothetical protein
MQNRAVSRNRRKRYGDSKCYLLPICPISPKSSLIVGCHHGNAFHFLQGLIFCVVATSASGGRAPAEFGFRARAAMICPCQRRCGHRPAHQQIWAFSPPRLRAKLLNSISTSEKSLSIHYCDDHLRQIGNVAPVLIVSSRQGMATLPCSNEPVCFDLDATIGGFFRHFISA